MVPAWWIVAAELGAQVDQQPSPSIQQPVTANLPIDPDRPDDLLVDQALDREPGQRPNLLTLAALPPDPLAGQDQLGTMADRTGGGHRFLVAPLQEHLPAGQGSRDGQVAARSLRRAGCWTSWVIATTTSLSPCTRLRRG